MSLISFKTAFSTMLGSMEKLSSGLRINRASDDPAGLVISEKLRSQIGSLNQEIENLSASINRYETASSTVSSLRSYLTEIREHAVAASNDGYLSDEARDALAVAAESLVETYNDTVANAEYNGSPMFDGSERALAEVAAIALEKVDFSSPEAAAETISTIDQAIRDIDSVQIELATTQKNDLKSRLSSLEVTRENLNAAESQIRDTDYALEVSNFIGSMIRTQASLAMLTYSAISGASVLKLFKI
ncbi:MAG: flagellin [candidate division Zixibacteria bacterium]|nr:flagellin [candidate division Zixibacteria bacterium]